MKIGVPRERSFEEYRVGLAPFAVRELARRGHGVMVERAAGEDIGAGDDAYVEAGATVLSDARELFAESDMIVKVQAPAPNECAMLRREQILLSHLHLASDAELARHLLATGAVCLAYETVSDDEGGRPLLRPLSEIAGHMAVQEAGHYLAKTYGRGVLLGGVPGAASGRVVVLGAGVVGTRAAQTAIDAGAEVVVIDHRAEALRRLDQRWGGRVLTLPSTPANIEEQVERADAVIGAAHTPGAPAPKLVRGAVVSRMRKGAVVIDVAIDEGGCFETSRPTVLDDPVQLVSFVVHYGVRNMPSAVPRTATEALNAAVLPFALCIAESGWKAALVADPHLRDGLTVALGRVTQEAVARSLGYGFTRPAALL